MKRQDKIALQRYQKKLDFARSSGGVNPYETQEQKAGRIAKAQKDFAFCTSYYFPHYANAKSADFHIKHSKKVARKKDYKGCVPWGRASAKSVLHDLLLPFWLWIKGEPIYMVIIGNNQDRAKQLLEDIRAEFEANPRIISDFGEQQNPGNWMDGFFITNSGFIGQALGFGQSVRGLRVKDKRPTYLVADDCETKELLKNPKRIRETVRWVEQDLIPTMDGDYRRYFHVQNRSAKDMVMVRLKERHPKWDWNQVNAYNPVNYKPAWPEKYSAQYFKNIETEIGRLAAMAEFNNSPHTEGVIFTENQIQWGKMPSLNHFDIICGWWDVAFAGTATADFNAIVLQGLYKQKDFWEIDTFVKQCKMRDAVRWMCQWQREKPNSVIIHWLFEAQFWNDEVERVIKEVQQEMGVVLPISKMDNPRTKKYDRIVAGLHPAFQNGRMWYNAKNKSHNDTQVGIAQLLGIEPGYKTNDDYPDAKVAGKTFLEKHISMNTGASRFNFGKMKQKNNW